MNWQVYIIRCGDDSLYTGITTDMERRLRQHAGGSGAKYCRGRLPLQVVYLETGHSRSTASKREAALKAATRAARLALIAAGPGGEADATLSQEEPIKAESPLRDAAPSGRSRGALQGPRRRRQ